MNVGLVFPGFSADERDWCIPALRNLVRELAVAEDVRVLALRYPHRAGRYEAFGAQVSALGGATVRRAGSARLWLRALSALAEEHRRRPFDVLHAFWATESGLIAALAGRVLGVPTIVSLAGGELVGLRDIGYGDQLVRSSRLKVRLALRMATAITAGSGQMCAGASAARRSTGDVRWLPLGVDTNLFRHGSAERDGGPPRLVHAASLVPVKDQRMLLRAAGLLRARGIAFQLDLAGEGLLDGELRRLAARLRLDGQVHFHGALRHDALPAFYRGAAAFVLTSRHEAQCMAALEAAACGVPAVGTAVGILPELEPGAALTVPVGRAEALAAALAELLEDGRRRRSMAQAARARTAGEFGLATCGERFRAMYNASRAWR